jgi:hypothetical protein
MKKLGLNVALVALLVGGAVFSTPSRAETGQVAVVFTKGGFIVDVGGGQGVLTFHGKRYPFTVSGMSLGFSIGASTSKFSTCVGPAILQAAMSQPAQAVRSPLEQGACSYRTPTASSYSSVVPGSALKFRPPWAV